MRLFVLQQARQKQMARRQSNSGANRGTRFLESTSGIGVCKPWVVTIGLAFLPSLAVAHVICCLLSHFAYHSADFKPNCADFACCPMDLQPRGVPRGQDRAQLPDTEALQRGALAEEAAQHHRAGGQRQ